MELIRLGYVCVGPITMKLKPLDAAELAFLRERVEAQYRAEGGTELEWKSYLPRYEDLYDHIKARIHGQADAAISPNILRRLFWETLGKSDATFNIVYLNAFARFISEGTMGYRDLAASRNTSQKQVEPVRSGAVARASDMDLGPAIEGSAQAPPKRPALEKDAARRSPAPPTEQVEHREPEPSSFRDTSGVATEDPQAPLFKRSMTLPSQALLRAFLVAALYSGLLSFAFVLLFNEISGYERLGTGGLRRLMVSWFGFTVFGHLALGLALAFYTNQLLRTDRPGRFFRKFLFTLPLLFILTFFTRQVFVSSGWLVNGRNAIAFFGKPDLETIAIALALCLFITLFLVVLHRGRVAGDRSMLLPTTLITLSCGTVFFSISAAHNILVVEEVLDPNGYFISPALLNYRFPHPERLPLICFMIFIQTFLSLKLLNECSVASTSLPLSAGTKASVENAPFTSLRP